MLRLWNFSVCAFVQSLRLLFSSRFTLLRFCDFSVCAFVKCLRLLFSLRFRCFVYGTSLFVRLFDLCICCFLLYFKTVFLVQFFFRDHFVFIWFSMKSSISLWLNVSCSLTDVFWRRQQLVLTGELLSYLKQGVKREMKNERNNQNQKRSIL